MALLPRGVEPQPAEEPGQQGEEWGEVQEQLAPEAGQPAAVDPTKVAGQQEEAEPAGLEAGWLWPVPLAEECRCRSPAQWAAEAQERRSRSSPKAEGFPSAPTEQVPSSGPWPC